MAEETNVKEIVEEIKNADEETLQKTIEDWFERTRTQGLKIGAQYISAAIFGIIQKHMLRRRSQVLETISVASMKLLKLSLCSLQHKMIQK